MALKGYLSDIFLTSSLIMIGFFYICKLIFVWGIVCSSQREMHRAMTFITKSSSGMSAEATKEFDNGRVFWSVFKWEPFHWFPKGYVSLLRWNENASFDHYTGQSFLNCFKRSLLKIHNNLPWLKIHMFFLSSPNAQIDCSSFYTNHFVCSVTTAWLIEVW